MDTLTSIKVFRQIVESGSFVAAAERLDLSTAMVSKHMLHVEKRLGTRLLNRNSRTLSLTEPGKVYYERGKAILEDLEATELELGSLGRSPRGTLRISCPSWFAGQILADALAEFRHRYPEIVVDVSFEDRYVDLVEEGFDFAFRVARDVKSLPPGLVARPIRVVTGSIGASQEYLARRGRPRSPQDLALHDCVAVGSMDSWTLMGPNGAIQIPVHVVVRYRSMAGVANAVAAGIGLAPLPATFFEDPVFKDSLVPVLPEFPFQPATVYAVYASRKYVPLKLRAFIDFAVEWKSKSPALHLAEREALDGGLSLQPPPGSGTGIGAIRSIRAQKM
jgi:DNA-binding transcriptional LysR family regulator